MVFLHPCICVAPYLTLPLLPSVDSLLVIGALRYGPIISPTSPEGLMSGYKKPLRTPTTPHADFLYASFDQRGANLQRNRSNSEVAAARKGLTRPIKTVTERVGLRRHTTDKLPEIVTTPRPNLQTATWETQIAEIEEDSKRIPLKTPNITEWSERLFYRRRSGVTNKSLVILRYEGVLSAGPPAAPVAIYRAQLLEGLALLRQHCQIAVLLHNKSNFKELEIISRDQVDAIYVSRNTETIGSGKQVWLQNYTQLIDDFKADRVVFVSCLELSNDEYEGKARDCMVAELCNGSWQFHV